MDRSQVEEKIKELISENWGVETSLLNPKIQYVQDLSADSLDIVEMTMVLEDTFDIPIPDEQAEKLFNIEVTVDYICSALQKRD